jgi:hypothetical protein
MYNAFPIRLVKELLWCTDLIGMALFVLSSLAIAPTISQLVTVYIVIIVGCYYDGCLAHGRLVLATLEAGVWLFLAIRRRQVFLFLYRAEPRAFPVSRL